MKARRAFVALDLNAETKRDLAAVSCALAESGADARWTKPENLHLTLKFLGPVAPETLDALGGAVSRAVAGFGPFDLRLADLGFFPNDRRPEVIWAGAAEGAADAARLAVIVEDCTAAAGFVKEKRAFQAHVTLGRLRSGRHADRLVAALRARRLSAAATHVEAAAVFTSDLTSDGPVYEIRTLCRFLP